MASSSQYALVTGVSRGIGSAIAEKLISDDWDVVGTYNRTEPSATLTESSKFSSVQVNLENNDELYQKLHPLILNNTPAVLINNAGISEDCDMEAWDAEWLELWDRTLQINLQASALLAKWCLQEWKKRQSGRLINIASRAAYRGDTAEYAAYAVSKAGMVAFGKSLLRNYGKAGLEVYCVAPGFVQTDMAKESAKVHGEDYLRSDIPMGYLPSPDEVAETVAFLASGKSPQLSGSTLHLNGGSYML